MSHQLPAHVNQKKILIVDDDLTHLAVGQQVLKRHGYSCFTCSSTLEARQLLDRQDIDILLLDARMPQEDGFDFCRHLKQGKFQALTILLVTGLDDDNSIGKAFNAGADDYLTKPVRWPLLIHRLQQLETHWFPNSSVPSNPFVQMTTPLGSQMPTWGARIQIENGAALRQGCGDGPYDCWVSSLIEDCGQWMRQNLQGNQEKPMVEISRIGTDEWVIAWGQNEQLEKAAEVGQALLQVWLNRFDQPIEIDQRFHRVNLRAGVTVIGATKSPQLAFEQAGHACHFGQTGKANVYHPSIGEKIQRAAEIEDLLYRDLTCHRLHLNYQPKLTSNDLTLIGTEALIRWHSEELGVVSPGEFIPVAEQAGFMDELSEWVVIQVVQQLNFWTQQKQTLVPVAINVPGPLLSHQNFVEHLLKLLDETQLLGGLIEIEVTESAMIDPSGAAIGNLKHLRDQGIKVAIDDFGTGYSSFSYLKELPVDTLKIDRSFVQKIHEDSTSLAIARAIVAVGHELGLTVVAEGVENHHQLSCLQRLNCDFVQGFLTGRPMVAQDMGAILAQAS